MYTIRADAAEPILRIDFSGRVKTGEALRALSQAMAMSDAANLTAIQCDLSEVDRGPAGTLMLAVVFSSRWHEPMRVAFIGRASQAPFVRRFMNFTGKQHAMGFFAAAEEPRRWLVDTAPLAAARPQRISSTTERHVRELFGPAVADTLDLSPAETTFETRDEPAA